jgi:AraC-like DNA-binding protein
MSRPSRTRTLASLLEQKTGGGDGNYPTQIQGLTLFRRSTDSAPSGVLYEPALCVVAQGAKRIMFGSREYRYDAEKYLLVAGDVPATAQIIGATPQVPYLGLKLLLEPLEVGDVVAQLGQRPRPSAAARAISVGMLDPGLLDAITRLVDLLADPQDSQVLAPLVRREITYRVLVGPDGARLRQIVSGADQGQRITHVLRWMKVHFAEPLEIDRLATLAGTGASAFHRHFKAVTGSSPLQYQKCLRLQEARRLMLGQSLDAAEASFRVGYESPSQFNREYRRFFGAPPRRDIEALRQIPAAAPVVPIERARGRRSLTRLTESQLVAALAES